MGEVRTDVRVRAEGLGIIVKTITTYLTLLYDSKYRQPGELALMAFALGQLAYSATVFGVYKSQFPESSLSPVSLPERQRASGCVPYPSDFPVSPALSLKSTVSGSGVI